MSLFDHSLQLAAIANLSEDDRHDIAIAAEVRKAQDLADRGQPALPAYKACLALALALQHKGWAQVLKFSVARIQREESRGDRLFDLCERLQQAHGFNKRADLHDAVLAASGQDEELVDEAVYAYCLACNEHAAPEKAFPELDA